MEMTSTLGAVSRPWLRLFPTLKLKANLRNETANCSITSFFGPNLSPQAVIQGRPEEFWGRSPDPKCEVTCIVFVAVKQTNTTFLCEFKAHAPQLGKMCNAAAVVPEAGHSFDPL